MKGEGEETEIRPGASSEAPCRVYWGSHGCALGRGHDGPHVCSCAVPGDPSDPRGDDFEDALNVGAPPYYGPETNFYGEDA